jgi:hypothetical protein
MLRPLADGRTEVAVDGARPTKRVLAVHARPELRREAGPPAGCGYGGDAVSVASIEHEYGEAAVSSRR